MKILIHRLLLLLCVALLTSCTTSRSVNYQSYERPYETVPARVARGVLKKLPNCEGIFYGNYGGIGSNGGRPVDNMDDLFRRHDIVYTEAKTWKVIRASDDVLVDHLKTIPESSLDPEGIAYRDKAIQFFERPVSKFVSKPLTSFVRFKEPFDSPFPDEESVIYFFSPKHSGFPDSK